MPLRRPVSPTQPMRVFTFRRCAFRWSFVGRGKPRWPTSRMNGSPSTHSPTAPKYTPNAPASGSVGDAFRRPNGYLAAPCYNCGNVIPQK